MPLVIFGLAVGVGILAISALSRGGLVTRSPSPTAPPTTTRAPAPVAPAAPGVSPGMVTATREAEALHDRIERHPEPERPRTSRATIITTGPTAPAATPAAEVEAPRPSAPSGPSRTVPSASASRAAIDGAHDPASVEADARAALSTLTTSGHPVARATAIRAFQQSYGHGLVVDGDYGRNTRRAMSLVLREAESALPSIRS